VIAERRPDALLVQGDTTTALCGALAGFYAGVPVGHVEAGLRTYEDERPFPEDANRRMVSLLGRWHWAPTQANADALLREGVPPARVAVTGNTVIDALIATEARPPAVPLPAKRAARRILVTLHRRETQGAPHRRLCRMLARVAARDDVEVLFPVHLSPAVRRTVEPELRGVAGVHLLEPLDYVTFVHAMRSSDLIVTDSGGIQEEAPHFGVPVLVMREATERPEAVATGCARVVGTRPATVQAEIERLLDDPAEYTLMAHAANPYGDGRAAERIVATLAKELVAHGRSTTIAA
jgi:UDP-N-acetylglucosamine 2-epimerase (non-hydrolysing)